MEPWQFVLLASLLFIVAALYASVGHGGASGYLAVLSLFAFAPREMATTALVLNVLVAGMAFSQFRRAGYFRGRLLLSFLAASVPAAFVGGLVHVPPETYALLLAAVLIVSAVRLAWPGLPGVETSSARGPALRVTLPAGAGIGLLSGVVGVGGGIFLSPVLLLLKWATVKETAAVSAAFIVVNSISGLAGRAVSGNWELGGLLWFVPIAFAGGVLGSYAGAWRLQSLTVRRLLGLVLLLAGVKLVLAVI
ncbi:MAG: sulfite exporter TauE/SafE family protein [Dehalococcoidia bacterium]